MRYIICDKNFNSEHISEFRTLVLESFAERLKVLIDGQPTNAFAKEVDIGESLLRKYLSGATPGIDKVSQISRAKGVALEWLINGEGPMRYDDPVIAMQEHPMPLSGAPSDLRLVPRLDVQASAGLGVVSYGEETLDYLAFQEFWLRQKGINPAYARVVNSKGDSMEPTIRDGDVLLVDTSVNDIIDHAIYVIIYGNMILVKRVQLRFDGSVILISDNPLFKDETVGPADVGSIKIAGRVMWFGRSI